jgi:pimeloyl-ACP methyl ester carboxylesterase
MRRYSATVVSSMAVALERLLAEREIDRLAWMGYSGGGVLAMLLAPRFPQTQAIVTVAANRDIDAWADHHGYLRLAGSLNPAEGRPPAHHYSATTWGAVTG